MRSVRAIGRLLVPLGALALMACATSVRLGGNDGGMPTPCGPGVTCAIGQVCCSESCGICVDQGEMCVDRSCGGPCDAFSAAGTGACFNVLGFVWNGVECVALSGCGCEGVDCPRRYGSLEECNAIHAECMPPGFCYSDAECTPEEFCSYPMGMCGAAAGMFAGICEPRTIESTCPAIYDPVCGCDGVSYDTECAARSAGISVVYPGPCVMADCAPDDARAEGDCEMDLGSAWNGMACAPLVGCECVGADCPDPAYPMCELIHERCMEPDLECGMELCYRYSQYCLFLSPDDDFGHCMPAMPCDPEGGVSCACVPEAMDTMGFDCGDDGAGGITVRQRG